MDLAKVVFQVPFVDGFFQDWRLLLLPSLMNHEASILETKSNGRRYLGFHFHAFRVYQDQMQGLGHFATKLGDEDRQP